MRLRAAGREIDLGSPLLMGVVNASPDSFSDAGELRDLDARVARAAALAAAGAGIIDVGGESQITTRPPISPDEEIERVVPLVRRVVAEVGVPVSVDTYKPAVAEAAVRAGACMVNDVSGLRDPRLAEVCAESGAALVLCHTLAPPKVKVLDPGLYGREIGAEVAAWLRELMGIAVDCGVREEQIVLDPGPDFAKTPAQTVGALRGIAAVRALGRPVLLAASRKDFIGAITGRGPRERLAGTLAAVGWGVEAGVSILRLHDVAEAADYLKVRAVLRGDAELEADARLAEGLRRV